MDLRTWSTEHRGDLAVHASQLIEIPACKKLGVGAGELATGAIVGIARLVDIHVLDRKQYEEAKDEHLGVRRFRQPMYAWVFEDPRRLRAPWPARGRLKLFSVDIPDSLMPERASERKAREDSRRNGTPVGDHEELKRRPVAPGMGYGMALYQRYVEAPGQLRYLYSEGPSQAMEKVAELPADRLRTVADEVMAALREAGFRPTELSAARKEPFRLPEEVGVRLGLLFLAVHPVAKVARSEAIAAGVQTMPTEEAYYWYSKTVHGPQARRAQRALRVLLSDGE